MRAWSKLSTAARFLAVFKRKLFTLEFTWNSNRLKMFIYLDKWSRGSRENAKFVELQLPAGDIINAVFVECGTIVLLSYSVFFRVQPTVRIPITWCLLYLYLLTKHATTAGRQKHNLIIVDCNRIAVRSRWRAALCESRVGIYEQTALRWCCINRCHVIAFCCPLLTICSNYRMNYNANRFLVECMVLHW